MVLLLLFAVLRSVDAELAVPRLLCVVRSCHWYCWWYCSDCLPFLFALSLVALAIPAAACWGTVAVKQVQPGTALHVETTRDEHLLRSVSVLLLLLPTPCQVWKVLLDTGAVGAIKDVNLERVTFDDAKIVAGNENGQRHTQHKRQSRRAVPEQRFNDCGSFESMRGCTAAVEVGIS